MTAEILAQILNSLNLTLGRKARHLLVVPDIEPVPSRQSESHERGRQLEQSWHDIRQLGRRL